MGIFTVRDTSNSNIQLLRDTLAQAKGPTWIESLELTVLASVRAFATDINDRIATGSLAPIVALVLNAGYMSKKKPRPTPDGFETTFQVNYLANFLLVQLLLQSMHPVHARIIYITSSIYNPQALHGVLPLEKEMWRPVPELVEPSLPDDRLSRTIVGLQRYAASKLWGMMFIQQLQKRLTGIPALRHIRALALDPGLVFSTNIIREQQWVWRQPLRKLLSAVTPCVSLMVPNGTLRTTRKVAKDILSACFGLDSRAFESWPDGSFLNGNRVAISSIEARDEEKQRQLWEGSLKLLDLHEEDTVFRLN
ncbi:MAG: hypothetical protein Q9166_006303 [cf. Caloplaca sp. 2 TL-2023]